MHTSGCNRGRCTSKGTQPFAGSLGIAVPRYLSAQWDGLSLESSRFPLQGGKNVPVDFTRGNKAQIGMIEPW